MSDKQQPEKEQPAQRKGYENRPCALITPNTHYRAVLELLRDASAQQMRGLTGSGQDGWGVDTPAA
jgi:hypothetical protein